MTSCVGEIATATSGGALGGATTPSPDAATVAGTGFRNRAGSVYDGFGTAASAPESESVLRVTASGASSVAGNTGGYGRLIREDAAKSPIEGNGYLSVGDLEPVITEQSDT